MFKYDASCVVLQPILKVSTALQSPNLELLTAVMLIKSFRLSLISLRNDPEQFKLIFENTETMCNKLKIKIPEVKKKISNKADDNPKTQHI